MDCERTEKVSALVDGELDEERARSLREHLAACSVCRRAEAEFLVLRREIKSYTVEDKRAAGALALHKILNSENVSFWKRRVALPAPALAALLLTVVALGVWIIFTRREPETERLAARAREEKREIAGPGAPSSGAGEIDLARFDHGGRAVIYKTRRANPSDANPVREVDGR